MLYTVIIPHYNSNGLVARTLDSIPKRDDIQVIVVDDLSTERSIDNIAKDKKYRHISFIIGDEKLTTGGARNEGIKRANGKYLLFSDSDDIFVQDAFNTFDNAIKTEKDFYMFKVTSFIEGTNNEGTRHVYMNKGMYNKKGIAKYLNNNQPVAKLVKKKLVHNNQIWFSETIGGDDMVFSAKVALYASTKEFIQEIVYSISQGNDSVTSSVDSVIKLSFIKEEIKRLLVIKEFNKRIFFKYIALNNQLMNFYELHKQRRDLRDLTFQYFNEIPLIIRILYSIRYIIVKELKVILTKK